jgi:bifunctional DNA-binding transcriptional regulator/antitoxin component of YhaV-PrlF toxin-antitoxin module
MGTSKADGDHTMAALSRSVRISNRGHVALPKELLRKHHLKAGDEVTIEDTDRGLLITGNASKEPESIEPNSAWLARPSPEEIARRRAVFAEIMAHRKELDIKPLTSTELIRIARAEEGLRDDDPDA